MDVVVEERAGAVSTLWLNRPDARNALSIELCERLRDAVAGVDADHDVRAVVVRGRGPVFCSGADFEAVAGPRAQEFLVAFEAVLTQIATCRPPVVAVLHGAALGGGLQLATACDFRLAARDVRIGIPAARLGIVVNYANVQRLVALVGPARAKEVLVAAREPDADVALGWGLLTEVVEPASLDEALARFVTRLAELAPLSVEGMKKAVATPGAEGRTLTDGLVAEAYASADLQEGLAALKGGRKPVFLRK